MTQEKRIIFSNDDYIEKDYRIYKGDNLEILPKIPKKTANLIFADPPYNLQLKQELYRPNHTKVDGVNDNWDQFSSFKEYDDYTEKWLSHCKNILTDDGTIWVIGSYHNIFRVGKIMMDLGYWILNDVIWHKSNPMPNFRGVRFTNATETIIWAKKTEYQKKYTFNHQVMKKFNNGKQMTSVWNIPLCTGNERIKGKDGKKAHSTQKPELLLRNIILSSTKENDLVLDPFLGSETTMAIAKKLNRKAIGIEKEKKYVEIAKNRLSSIDAKNYVNMRITEPKKEVLQRVSMKELVDKNFLQKDQKLFSKCKSYVASLLEDGSLRHNNDNGSIHQISAKLKNAESFNGWLYWYIEKNDNFVMIDEIRKLYRNKYAI